MKELEQLQKEHQELGKRIQELKDSLNNPKAFEVGGWYRYKGALGPIVNYQCNDMGFGFNYLLNWINLTDTWTFCTHPHNWQPATEQEVKDALIKEAERMGYKVGVLIKSFIYGHSVFKDDGFTGFENNCLTNFWYKGSIVMKDGQWATIIKDETIKIGGYEVKFHQMAKDGNWYSTTIDGYGFSHSFWLASQEISLHSKAKVMIGCSKQYDVSLETINKILDKLK